MRYYGNTSSNSASDSWAIQALVSACVNPMEWKNNVSVVEHLLSLQSDEGYFKYTKYTVSNPIYMTASAIMALLGKPQPILSITNESAVIAFVFERDKNETTAPTIATVTPFTPTTVTPTTTAVTPKVTTVPGFEAVVLVLILIALAHRKL
jgi:hypothetical protein